MKLNRLASTTQQHSQDAIERARHVAGERVRRVDALEGVEGDRQRSLQQEIAEFDARAIGPFAGDEHMLQGARQVAAKLTLLGPNLKGLLKLQALSLLCVRIDDKA
jgi:hypothetical protein